MINKRWITLPVVYSRPFTSKAVFWAILNEFEFAVDCSIWNSQRRAQTTQTSFPLSQTSFTPNKNGEQIAIADNQVAKIEKKHFFVLLAWTWKAKTTALNRSTAMRIRSWIETAVETFGKNQLSRHKIGPRRPLTGHESTYIPATNHGKRNIG